MRWPAPRRDGDVADAGPRRVSSLNRCRRAPSHGRLMMYVQLPRPTDVDGTPVVILMSSKVNYFSKIIKAVGQPSPVRRSPPQGTLDSPGTSRNR